MLRRLRRGERFTKATAVARIARTANAIAFLRRVDAYLKETWPNEGFASEPSRELLRSEASLTLGTSEGELDVLHRIDGIDDYASLREMSRPITLENGRRARVISLSGSIRSKRASNRDKDPLHLLELEALEEMRLEPLPPVS